MNPSELPAPFTPLAELVALRAAWRRAGRTVVLTNGAFDLLHAGHVAYLAAARALGDVLIAGLNSDSSVRAYKGPTRPLVPEAQRGLLLAALRSIDYVTLFDTPTAIPLVEALQPDVYVKGGDYAHPAADSAGKHLPEAPAVLAYGGRVELIAYRAGLSTSALIERIIERCGGGAPGVVPSGES